MAKMKRVIKGVKGGSQVIKPRQNRKPKVESPACVTPDCKETCDQRQEMESRLRDIAGSNIALHVQCNEQRKALQDANRVLDEATGVVSTAAVRLNDARATLEVFCGANLGVDIRHHYKKAEGNNFESVLSVHTPQQQVCAKAVARLASMLYTILTREL